MPSNVYLTAGMTVRARGERFRIVEATPLSTSPPLSRLLLRSLEGETRGTDIVVLPPLEPVEPDEIPDLSLDRPGRLPRFRLLHDAFKLKLAPPNDLLVGPSRSRIRFEPYQYVPAMRALQLPRPRLLLADDVGLGKTIEAGLVLRDLAARRRAARVLIVAPAGIMNQWQRELQVKFGFNFEVFDSEKLHEVRTRIEIGSNPWAVEPRVIASMDLIKRREGTFRELSSTKWDVIIVDEAHHLSAGRNEDDVTDRHRLGRWISEATDALFLLTATPHDGYDVSFSSLLSLLEPSLVAPDGAIRYQRYRHNLVRRLKGHIRNDDGTPKFLQREVQPLPVSLSPAEAALHAAVMAQASEMETFALQARSRPTDAEAIRLVATILRKRAASSRKALAHTLTQRTDNVRESVEEIELQRDHLRSLRRGETISDESLARLERDAHRSYLSVMRRLGTRVRRAEEELAAITKLQTLLNDCAAEPESKMVRFLATARAIHASHPQDKIIVFSEYSDTISAIAEALQASPDYAGKFGVLTGDLKRADRDQALAEFASPQRLLLLATDAAGEGLNLQKHCHRIIHFELPWNPNRLEQRNGRIDRYGQAVTPIVGFLYAQATYEGEVLSRLVDKIERQVRRLGSVGDVLGQIQAERIEELLARSPTDLQTALREAEREMEEEINRAEHSSARALMGDGSVDADELQSARDAAARGSSATIDSVDFLSRAVLAAGGRCQCAQTIRVETPPLWRSGFVQPLYENLIPPTAQLPEDEPNETVLDPDHPLLMAAVRWVKGSRFDSTNDHRLAYVCSPALPGPDLVATFLVQLRDAEGIEIERLEAVRLTPDGTPSTDRNADLAALNLSGEANVPTATLTSLFGSWWQSAREAALTEARRRAAEWRRAIVAYRGLSQIQLQDELRSWAQVTRQSILGPHAAELAQPRLFGTQPQLPPATKRRLRQHDERIRQRQQYLDRRLQFDEPAIEPLGVLLRVPASALCLTAPREGGRP